MALYKFQKRCFSCLQSQENCTTSTMPIARKPESDPSATTKFANTREENNEKMNATEEPSMVRGSSTSSGNSLLLVSDGEKPYKEYTFRWAKKYQPKFLKDFICHKEKAKSLQSRGPFDHCVFEGPPGVGKRTMALALLRECMGSDIIEISEEYREFNLSVSKGGPISSTHIKVSVSSQSKLIQIDVSEIKWDVTDVVLELLKESYTSSQAIILNEADSLPKDAQLQIKSFLETCRGNYKVIFCGYDISKLQNLTSICMVIQLLPPPIEQIVEVLNFIAKKEEIELPSKLASKMADKSNHCLQQAIRSFEATWHSNYPFTEGQLVLTGWEEEVAIIAKSVIQEQTPKRLFIVRQKLQILLKHNLCPHFVFVTLVEELKRELNDQIEVQIGNLRKKYNADYEGHLVGRRIRSYQDKESYEQMMRTKLHKYARIEEFAAEFMSLYKNSGIKLG